MKGLFYGIMAAKEGDMNFTYTVHENIDPEEVRKALSTAGDLYTPSGHRVKAGSYLVSNGNSMQWVSGDYWDASIQNGQRRENELRLIEELTQKYNKEFTCEFCNRANPIGSCECERCGAPRKAV